jgi:hypothetical protein
MENLVIENVVDFTTGQGVKAYMAQRNASAVTLETKAKAVGENGMLAFDVPTFGDVAVMPEARKVMQEPTATADADLATAGLDLCSDCNVKLSDWLTQQRKRQYKNNVSPFDTQVDATYSSITTEAEHRYTSDDARMTNGGLLAPEWGENIFQEDTASLTLGGLRRPDAGMPSEQEEQLRQLFLSKPAPKQRRVSLETLKQLGFVPDDDVSDAIDPTRITKGGLIEPL